MHSTHNSRSALAVNLICLAALGAAAIALARDDSNGRQRVVTAADGPAGDIFASTQIANWAQDTIAAEELLNRARSLQSAGCREEARTLYRQIREQYRHLDQAAAAAEELDLIELSQEYPWPPPGPSPPAFEDNTLPEIDAVRLALPRE